MVSNQFTSYRASVVPPTSSSRGDTGPRKHHDAVAFALLDVVGDGLETARRKRMGRDGGIHGPRFFLAHLACLPAGDTRAQLVAIASSSAYVCGEVAETE